jgi:putative toxin-antitoxin system antitoxin component (TIGR02293 family)
MDITAIATLLGENDSAEQPNTWFEFHKRIMAGFPYPVLGKFTQRLRVLPRERILKFVYVHEVAWRDHRDRTGRRRLTMNQSARLWIIAETLAYATVCLGGVRKAEEWLLHTCGPEEEMHFRGITGYQPMELLETSVGQAIVRELLRVRSEHQNLN